MCIQSKPLVLPLLRIFVPSHIVVYLPPSLLATAASCFLCLLASMAGQLKESRGKVSCIHRTTVEFGEGICLVFPWVCML